VLIALGMCCSTLRLPRGSGVRSVASHLLNKRDVSRRLASALAEVRPLSIPALDSKAAKYSLLQRKCRPGRSDSANGPSGSRRIP
jgi:hypothetical protein